MMAVVLSEKANNDPDLISKVVEVLLLCLDTTDKYIIILYTIYLISPNNYEIDNLRLCLRSIKLTSIAGLTGLHNCDQAEVERHAAEVISHLTRLCLEAGDQVTADQSEHGIWSHDPVMTSYWPGPGPGDQRGGAPLHQLRARRPRHRGARVACLGGGRGTCQVVPGHHVSGAAGTLRL